MVIFARDRSYEQFGFGVLLWPSPLITGTSPYGKVGSPDSPLFLRLRTKLVGIGHQCGNFSFLLAQVDSLRPDAAAKLLSCTWSCNTYIYQNALLGQRDPRWLSCLAAWGLALSLCDRLFAGLFGSASKLQHSDSESPRQDQDYRKQTCPMP